MAARLKATQNTTRIISICKESVYTLTYKCTTNLNLYR